MSLLNLLAIAGICSISYRQTIHKVFIQNKRGNSKTGGGGTKEGLQIKRKGTNVFRLDQKYTNIQKYTI